MHPVLAPNSHLIREESDLGKTTTASPHQLVPQFCGFEQMQRATGVFLPSAPFEKLPCVSGDQISDDVEAGREEERKKQKARFPASPGPLQLVGFRFSGGIVAKAMGWISLWCGGLF